MVIRLTNKVHKTHLRYWFFKPDRLVKVSDFLKWFQSDLFKNRLKLDLFWVLLFWFFYTTCKNAWTKIKNALRPARTPRRVFDFFIITNKKYCTVLYSTVQTGFFSPDFFPRISSTDFFPGFFSPDLFPELFSPILDHRGVQGFISKLKSGKKIQRYEIMLDFFPGI